MPDAGELDSAHRAERVLERLPGSLERDHPGAAASIGAGLVETLTVQRLGLTGALERTLRTTNIIQNLMALYDSRGEAEQYGTEYGGAPELVKLERRSERVYRVVWSLSAAASARLRRGMSEEG